MSRTHVTPSLSQKYLEPLLKGERDLCRRIVEESLAAGISPADLLNDLVWPTMEKVQELYRDDRITISAVNLATRLNRALTDQLTARLPRSAPKGKKVLIFCGDDEPEELGGQICADLFECDGWNVKFAGGGVPEDEVLSLIGSERPELLVMFGTLPAGVPAVRKLIDYLREVNSCPEMQIMCCGGIYKRAEGLAEEIGADLFAAEASDAIRVANDNPTKKATVDQQTVGRMRRIRKAQLRRVDRVAPSAEQVA
ncbi:cobalamin B12-binding domain-containing protein [Humisphaera borealis]|uniref:B12-binding domain-containing protein n=1 Tax=Humisphaera borealis TaxID=2807512 RepID=A0A7M2WSE1_9BACT|nr:B12-binding domain-containing protein [Humisphaera borealis]QOV87510.1 B12-binding domain-containing protein [Humisphaera borealis]